MEIEGVPDPAPTSPTSWSVDDVANWVEGVVGAEYAAIFRQEQVSGSATAMFEDVTALEPLIPRYGPRFALVHAFKALHAPSSLSKKRQRVQDDNQQSGQPPLKKTLEWREEEQITTSTGEGLRPCDPIASLRIPTCQQLEQKLAADMVVLVRSPPFTGKTSLGGLFETYLLRGGTPVKRMSFLRLRRLDDFDDYCLEHLGCPWEEALSPAASLTLIFDETQMIYALGKGHPFWNTIKDIQSATSATRVLMFAAYGEKPTGTAATYATPIEMTRLDLSTTLFKREEFDEVMAKCDRLPEASRLRIGPVGKEAIWSATGGHPGLVRRCLDLILHDLVSILAEQGDTPNGVDDSPAVLRFLLSHTFFLSLKHTRAVPSSNNFNIAEIKFLERLLFAPSNEGISSEDVPESLIALGIVGFRSATHVVFASPLYRNVLVQRLYDSRLRPLHPVYKLYDLVRSCVVRMNPEYLRRSLSRGAEDEPLYERHWQMEFYRAATSQLSTLHTISPDVGALFNCNGFLDFYVNGGLNWGIELLREGDRTAQHAARFDAGGTYAAMKENLKEHVLIDFRTKEVKQLRPNFVYVIYSDDYRKAVLKRLGHEDDEVSLMGHEVMADSDLSGPSVPV